MVSIPVKLYGATSENKISMNQLHAECQHKVSAPRRCPDCDLKQLDALYEILSEDKILDPQVLSRAGELIQQYASANLSADQIIKGYPIGRRDGEVLSIISDLMLEAKGGEETTMLCQLMDAAGVEDDEVS